MLYFTDYFWFSNYNESDILWLDESLNWDASISYTIAEYVPLLSLTLSYFANTHYATDWLTVISFIEYILTMEILPSTLPLTLFVALITDLTLAYLSIDNLVNLLLHSDYQDWIINLLQHTPELIFAFLDWNVMIVNGNSYSTTLESVFDTIQDSPSIYISEFVESFTLLLIYTWFLVLTTNFLRLRVFPKVINPFITRLTYYFFSYACELRIQVDAMFEIFFLGALFLTMMILTFDDDREEVLEFFNLNLFYLFLAVFVFHVWKYSVHYLSFLDTSRKGSSSVKFLLGQFLFDFLNLIGFSLRFVLLMARLNIYDGVDDILDSYYILFIDFDEDEYFMETFPNTMSFSYFDTDVHDDRSFLLEDEVDFILDFYTIYATLWGKYVFYLSFILEEFARVGLALLVTYLLIFEINAVNRSYNEDTYFSTKK